MEYNCNYNLFFNKQNIGYGDLKTEHYCKIGPIPQNAQLGKCLFLSRGERGKQKCA